MELAPNTPVLSGSLDALIVDTLPGGGDEGSWSYDDEVGLW